MRQGDPLIDLVVTDDHHGPLPQRRQHSDGYSEAVLVEREPNMLTRE